MTAVARRPWRRVVFVVGPPAAWMAHLLVSYLLVPPTCGTTTIPLHVATVILAVAASASTLTGGQAVGGDRRFPTATVAWGGIFVFAIVLQGLANAMVDPCA